MFIITHHKHSLTSHLWPKYNHKAHNGKSHTILHNFTTKDTQILDHINQEHLMTQHHHHSITNMIHATITATTSIKIHHSHSIYGEDLHSIYYNTTHNNHQDIPHNDDYDIFHNDHNNHLTRHLNDHLTKPLNDIISLTNDRHIHYLTILQVDLFPIAANQTHFLNTSFLGVNDSLDLLYRQQQTQHDIR